MRDTVHISCGVETDNLVFRALVLDVYQEIVLAKFRTAEGACVRFPRRRI